MTSFVYSTDGVLASVK